jgi:hypothetical protein
VQKTHRKVKLIDVSPSTVLEFDTFLHLPASNRHIKFAPAGDAIEQERSDRLQSHAVNSLSIASEDIQTFCAYSTEALNKLGKADGAVSATERPECLESTVRKFLE